MTPAERLRKLATPFCWMRHVQRGRTRLVNWWDRNAFRIDHDRLFKELISTFFIEFLALFLPEICFYIEEGSLEFLDKEIFTDI
ncbi:MAG TPA: hypothetical protein VJX67_23475, partial [Blastocatellia bacterium]|nr:hypothetical protein [Blastocatellia bacterium]